MNKEQYIKMTQVFRNHPNMARVMIFFNYLITYAIFISYPLVILYLLWNRDSKVILSVLVPTAGFLLLTEFRKRVNRPRPYEKFETEPIIPKDTVGKSFPSRHVFSASVIALTYLYALPQTWLGILALVGAGLLALIRVLSGIHFISDVLAGMLWAMICGWVGYLLLAPVLPW